MATVTTTHSKGDCYKYAWARFVAKKTLEDDLNSVKALISTFRAEAPASNIFPELPQGQDLDNASIADLHKGLHGYTGGGVTPPQPGNFRVGIVGAGVSGLFTALLFDWLNEHPKLKGKLRIDYDITEAADEARLGGRLYTHRFSKEEHDYYDVGAMRFPENPVMNRLVMYWAKTEDSIEFADGRNIGLSGCSSSSTLRRTRGVDSSLIISTTSRTSVQLTSMMSTRLGTSGRMELMTRIS